MDIYIKSFLIRLRLILFYIFNPKFITGFIPILIDLILKGSKRNNNKKLSKSICQNNCISVREAIKFFTKADILASFHEIHKEQILESKERVLHFEKRKGFDIETAADLDLLYWLVKKLKIEYVLETGVASGWSSMAILKAQENFKNNKLISIDMPFYNIRNPNNYVGLAVSDIFKKDWILIREADRIGIPKAFKYNYEFGLVHYDSDKTYFGKKWALNYIWERLGKGAILIVDDIVDDMLFHNFTNQKKLNPIIVSSNKKFIGLIKK